MLSISSHGRFRSGMESDILRLNLANLGEAQNGKEAGAHIPRVRGAQIEAKSVDANPSDYNASARSLIRICGKFMWRSPSSATSKPRSVGPIWDRKRLYDKPSQCETNEKVIKDGRQSWWMTASLMRLKPLASVYSVLVLATHRAAAPRYTALAPLHLLSPFRDRGAGNVVEVPMDSLAPKAKVKRSGSWSEIESVDLVAGYMISFKTSDNRPRELPSNRSYQGLHRLPAPTGEWLPQRKTFVIQSLTLVCVEEGESVRCRGEQRGPGVSGGFGRRGGHVVLERGGSRRIAQVVYKNSAQIGSFWLVATVIAEILVLFAGFKYSYRRVFFLHPSLALLFRLLLLLLTRSRSLHPPKILVPFSEIL
ncbi:hypothetical protein B0H14DRAFT_2585179 [Mycena olivaceomarginata]|nr:hypothetical protein B0H14DRAFT_2585179 [Mycena olivaceomarginata]